MKDDIFMEQKMKDMTIKELQNAIKIKIKQYRNNIPSKFEIEFWYKWLHGDGLNKLELVKTLPLSKDIISIWHIKEITPIIKQHCIANLINSYFSDLEQAIYTNMESVEDEKGKK